MQKMNLKIEGMTCDHCVHHVTEALKEIPGVDTVEVSLKENRATVEIQQEIPRETFDHAVEEAGYQVTEAVAV